MFCSTDLRTMLAPPFSTTNPFEIVDSEGDGRLYYQVDVRFAAWLFQRLNKARQACEEGRLPQSDYDGILVAALPVENFCLASFPHDEIERMAAGRQIRLSLLPAAPSWLVEEFIRNPRRWATKPEPLPMPTRAELIAAMDESDAKDASPLAAPVSIEPSAPTPSLVESLPTAAQAQAKRSRNKDVKVTGRVSKAAAEKTRSLF